MDIDTITEEASARKHSIVPNSGDEDLLWADEDPDSDQVENFVLSVTIEKDL